ncbi:MAG: class I SAM-dependent methyltransferase [Anaerolineae bacterium]
MKVFDFSANWERFSDERLNVSRLTEARESLVKLLQRESLEGVSFLDVGCGSGLFSIAAYHLGAGRVVGIDVNPGCVALSVTNCRLLAPNAPIQFRQVSALDRTALDALGCFDIVYAWGVLHHTGAMWEAIDLTLQRVAPGGDLVVAIYNKHITSPIWNRIKWLYNQLPGWGRGVMAWGLAGVIYIAKFIVTRRNPLEKERGMDFWYDVVDWIGGYPYEYATPEAVETFINSRGFQLSHFVPAQVPTGCNEFVFKKFK